MNNTLAQLARGRGSSLICRGSRHGGQKLYAMLLRPYGTREDKQDAHRCLRSLRGVDLHDDGPQVTRRMPIPALQPRRGYCHHAPLRFRKQLAVLPSGTTLQTRTGDPVTSVRGQGCRPPSPAPCSPGPAPSRKNSRPRPPSNPDRRLRSAADNDAAFRTPGTALTSAARTLIVFRGCPDARPECGAVGLGPVDAAV
jgi:hypothetical protein